MLCETGAEGAYQTQFLSGIAELPSEYPNLKAVVYFNSHGPLGTNVMNGQALSKFAQISADTSVVTATAAS